MSDKPLVLLQHHLRKLRLPTFKSEYAKLARQCAAEGRDDVQYLLRLCELELIERERRMIERRIKAAKFPATKSLDSFDFMVIASLNKVLTMELARCAFIDRRENIIALGPSGTGKTQVSIAVPGSMPARRAWRSASPPPRPKSMNSWRPSTTAGSSASRRALPPMTC